LDDENPVVSSTDGKEKEDDLSESDKADLLFADGNSRKAYDELKLMLRPECTIEQIGEHALKTLVFLLQLGQIEKGSLTMDLKYKSLSARWFGSKTNKGGKDDNADAVDDKTKYIQCDSHYIVCDKRKDNYVGTLSCTCNLQQALQQMACALGSG
jgi:hypothetical protein